MNLPISLVKRHNLFISIILSASVWYIEEGRVMKAFVVLDNDVCFYTVDAEFKKYMLQKCLSLKIVKVCFLKLSSHVIVQRYCRR